MVVYVLLNGGVQDTLSLRYVSSMYIELKSGFVSMGSKSCLESITFHKRVPNFVLESSVSGTQ